MNLHAREKINKYCLKFWNLQTCACFLLQTCRSALGQNHPFLHKFCNLQAEPLWISYSWSSIPPPHLKNFGNNACTYCSCVCCSVWLTVFTAVSVCTKVPYVYLNFLSVRLVFFLFFLIIILQGKLRYCILLSTIFQSEYPLKITLSFRRLWWTRFGRVTGH